MRFSSPSGETNPALVGRQSGSAAQAGNSLWLTAARRPGSLRIDLTGRVTPGPAGCRASMGAAGPRSVALMRAIRAEQQGEVAGLAPAVSLLADGHRRADSAGIPDAPHRRGGRGPPAGFDHPRLQGRQLAVELPAPAPARWLSSSCRCSAEVGSHGQSGGEGRELLASAPARAGGAEPAAPGAARSPAAGHSG